MVYGRLGVDIASAVVASVMPFESAWTSDKKLLSPFHIAVNESIWAVQPAEKCLGQYVAQESMTAKNAGDSVVLSLAKALSAVSIAHEVGVG